MTILIEEMFIISIERGIILLAFAFFLASGMQKRMQSGRIESMNY